MDLPSEFESTTCLFCCRSQDESELVDMNVNSVVIEDDIIDFSDIIYDFAQLKFKHNTPNLVCDECQSIIIQFCLFKRNNLNNNSSLLNVENENTTKVIINKVKTFLNEYPNLEELTAATYNNTCLAIIPKSEREIMDNFQKLQSSIMKGPTTASTAPTTTTTPIKKRKMSIVYEEIESYEDVKQDWTTEIVQQEMFNDMTEEPIDDRQQESSDAVQTLKDINFSWTKQEIKTVSAIEEKPITNIKVQLKPLKAAAEETKPVRKNYFNIEGSSRKNVCDVCGLKFTSQEVLKSHQNSHKICEAMSKYQLYTKCELCSVIYCNDEDFNSHLLLHDDSCQDTVLEAVPSLGIIHKQGTYFTEPKVEDIYPIDGQVVTHCGHCLAKFKDDTDAKVHLMLFHARCFICPIENREFTGTAAYTNHLKTSHPEFFPDTAISCPHCLMVFSTIYDKLAHMKYKCQDKKFHCDHCGKKFFRKYELTNHLKLISGVSVFSCQICGKKCKDNGDLKTHQRSHTNERPYQCSLCPNAYKTSSARAAHVQSHGEADIVCKICSVRFKARRVFKKHMKTQHDEEYRQKCLAEFSCTICAKNFLRSTAFKSHMKNVHNIIIANVGGSQVQYVEEYLD